ncbi:hypothetical protein [Pelagicoccus sp. SDUM812002]|uniref:hypothetical protein n=1 Tax=Pelagicoccus sp. SDUM812002 TaxID=3041266 RepID=UPI00280EC440|nr:hypothetical protein [Pelagicoccus sp. SDUM812002]MDQ8184375.1 hypothetical protein [Pelagicoccus sp. SDUM812002]
MALKFKLTIDSFETANELPSTWPSDSCRALLQQLEFSDADSAEPDQLRDYAVMALQDLEIEAAARALLDFTFGDKLPKGKKQNIAEDIQREPLWEEYPDLAYHEPIFNIQRLFNLAFDQTPKPEVNRLHVTLSGTDQPSETYLDQILSTERPEPFIVRCLAAALPDSAILKRLFEDPINSTPFAEAEHIVWHVQTETAPESVNGRKVCRLTLYCPKRWSNELDDAPETLCQPFLDKPHEEE